jgi:hypothetical protein
LAADSVYDAVERRLQRRKKGPATFHALELSCAADRAFADLKPSVKSVAKEAWSAIPEALDISNQARLRKEAEDREAPGGLLPDSVIFAERSRAAGHMYVPKGASEGTLTLNSGLAAASASGGLHSLSEHGAASAPTAPERAAGQTAAPTALESLSVAEAAQRRTLLKAAVAADPRSAIVWLAAVQLELQVGKVADARTLLASAVAAVPDNEQLWLAFTRAALPQDRDRAFVTALEHCPAAAAIWTEYLLSSPPNSASRRALAAQAIQAVPSCARLWQLAAEAAETPLFAAQLLERAVAAIQPSDPALPSVWVALATSLDISPPPTGGHLAARAVFSRARAAFPHSAAIWQGAISCEARHDAPRPRLLAMTRKAIAASNDSKVTTWVDFAATLEHNKCASAAMVVALAAGEQLARTASPSLSLAAELIRLFSHLSFSPPLTAALTRGAVLQLQDNHTCLQTIRTLGRVHACL